MDYSNTKVVLKDPRRFEIKFIGDTKVKLSRIIFVLKVKRLVNKGHTTYLECIIMNTKAPQNNPSKVPIVCKYLEVFLEELSALS